MNTEKPVTISRPVRPFSAEQKLTLEALMNLMIPASNDGKMPAAKSLGLFDDLTTLPTSIRTDFERGLAWLNEQANNAHNKAFSALTETEATALVDTQRLHDPAFVNAFTLHTTARYMQDDGVMTALGLEARPHWPKGHQVDQGDWSLLEPVKRRGPIWREV